MVIEDRVTICTNMKRAGVEASMLHLTELAEENSSQMILRKPSMLRGLHKLMAFANELKMGCQLSLI